ncbi:MAG: hypothetical protein DMF89_09415 [Acidobacteria bacterium]|nr:MAG: hypothetical protein DMF89_09415 [Acidobacteriota bacterium]
MTEKDVTSLTDRERARSLKRRGWERTSNARKPHAMSPKGGEDTGYVEMRADDDFRGRITLGDVREEEQRQ